MRLHLTNSEFKDLIEVIRVANCATNPTSMRQSVLPTMQKIFRAQSAGFLLAKNDQKGLDFTNPVNLDMDEHSLDSYRQYYYKLDPFLTALDRPTSTVGDLVPYYTWTKLEYYQEFLRKMDIYYMLGISLYSGTRLLGGIALHRPKEAPEFGKRETAIARILVPHLTAALENTQTIARLATELDLYRNVNELSSTGIIILDNELQPIYYNDKAKVLCLSMLHRQNGQARESEREEHPVPSEILHDCLALKELLRGREQEQIAAFSPTRIMYGEQNEVLKITTFPTRQFSQDISTSNFLVRIEDLSEIGNTRREALKKEHHLTAREIEIIRLVCEGLTNEEISKRLCISRFTVYTHVKNIFEKTGIRHRAKLASCGLSQQCWYASEINTSPS